jgi:predicted glycosyl hydrolase (DUF1957 family)
MQPSFGPDRALRYNAFPSADINGAAAPGVSSGEARAKMEEILRETLLTVSSDWPFMVSKDSAAGYARYRAHLHAHATREIADALAAGRRDAAERLAQGWNRADGLFGALDARRLPRG